MDGQIGEPAAGPEQDVGDEPDGQSGLRRLMRRATSILKTSRESNSTERLTEFLSQEAKDGGGRSREERALLLNVAKLRDLRIEDVMVPRADIVAVGLDASLEETLEEFRKCAHSRLPVYRETLDDPVGVVHLKDLALSHGFGAPAGDFTLSKHLRSVLVVPPSMRAQALLQRMQATRRHMALVIDEYGGVDGLVTIEDLIEQIVGEIEDEHDDAERPLWIQQGDGAYLTEARAGIEDFAEGTGLDLRPEDWDDEVDTLGGLIFTLCGRVPERGEVIQHPGGFEFEIVDADPRRVKRLRIIPADRSPRRDGDAQADENAAATTEDAADAPAAETSSVADRAKPSAAMKRAS